MALCKYSRTKPEKTHALFGYGSVTVGSDCFLDQSIESVNDHVCYCNVVERVMPGALNLEECSWIAVGDNVAGRVSVVGNIVVGNIVKAR